MYRYTNLRAYVVFAAFGAFWGTWGASVPAIRDQTGLSEGELGTALLCVGAGALPAMPIAGRAVDRWGDRVAATTLVLLGVAGVAVALAARDLMTLAAGLVVLGATSGAADVAINATASAAERTTARPVLTRAHGAFSAAVVVSSLLAGALHGADAPLALPFVVALAVAALAAAALVATATPAAADRPAAPGRRPAPPAVALPLTALLLAGGLGALAYAVENAHQSWGAVYLADVLAADPAVAAAGPAVFAGVAAVSRFAVSAVRLGPVVLVVAGAGTAAGGSALVAAAGSVPVALAGLALAAAGTAVVFPTLLAAATAQVGEGARGRATSVVTTVAYLGFLAGPAYVGAWAAATSLPGAMLAVAGLAAALALLTPPAAARIRAAGLAARAPAGAPAPPTERARARGT